MKQQGFSLIEIILAAALFIIFSSGIVGIVFQGLESNRLGSEVTIANQYATEGIEGVRSIRNQAFANVTNSLGIGISKNASNVWQFNGVNNTFGKYARVITVGDVNRDASGNIVSTGGTLDSDTKRITSTVTWNVSLARTDNITLSMYLTNFRKLISSGEDALLAYGDGITSPTNNPRSRTYTVSSNTFGAEGQTVTGTLGRNFIIRTSPTKKEAIVGYTDNSGTFRVLCFDGTTWTQEWSATVGGTGTTRRFDVAYETNSGDVMVLYSANVATTNELTYRTKVGTTGCGAGNWGAATSLNPLRTSGIVQWVKMNFDRRSSSNLITALWADASSDLSAMVWSGSAWGNEPAAALETALEVASAAQDVDSFEIEYQSVSGNVMVVWGSGGSATANGAYFTQCIGGTSTCTWGAKTAITGLLNDATNLDISANPATNEIVFASIGNAGADLQAAYWSGSAWTGSNDIDITARAPLAGTKLITTGWVISGATTRSVVLYNNATTTTIQGFVGNGGVFTRQGGADPAVWFTPAPLFANPQKWYDIQANPKSPDTLLFTLSDNNVDLFSKRLIMTSTPIFTWTNADSGAALETTLGQSTAEPFSFAFWRNP